MIMRNRTLLKMAAAAAGCGVVAAATGLVAKSSAAPPASGAGAGRAGPPPIVGFADLHTHHMGHLNFDGEWMSGLPSGPKASALARCNNPIHALGGALGRKAHVQAAEGYPGFRDWPTWDNVEHQSIYETWLEDAHKQGLKLLGVSLTTFEPLCRALKLINLRKDMVEDCRDMRVVGRQLAAVKEFERTHAWYKIVRTPAEARSAIADGKLAIVLGLEVSNLFDEDHFGRWEDQLDKWHADGIRTIIPIHELDNRFGRAASQDEAFAMLELVKSHKNLDDQQSLLSTIFKPKGNPDGGLTDAGEALITRMMEKKMLIDVTHMDTSGIDEVIGLTQRNAFYPFFASHTYLWETMTDEQKKKTKHLDARVVNAIKRSGGLVGLRTGPEEQVMYRPGRVDNTCHGSSRSFAQGYAFATMALGVPVAFGTDMNGMIESLGPRFGSGNDSCSWAYRGCGKLSKLVGACDAYKDERAMQQAIQGSAAREGIGTDFDAKGFARIDHIDDLARDLEKMGLDTRPLNRGAESFIRMWERTEQKGRTALASTGAFKNGRCGTDQSDFACEMSKSERSAWAKTQKKEGDCGSDGECGAGLFCDKGTLTVGANTCKRRLTDGSLCDRAAQCASNTCNTLRCITPNSKNMGEACYVGAECRVGKCSAALGGTLVGKCVCDSHDDCSSSQYCWVGTLGVGTNECRTKLADYAGCTSADQCSGGACRTKCYHPASKAFGASCEVEPECKQGTCSAALLGLVNGRCVCTGDSHCGSGSYCNTGVAGVGTNVCKPKLAKGKLCTKDHQCLSNRCTVTGCRD